MKKVLSIIFIVLLSMFLLSCGYNSPPLENNEPQEPPYNDNELQEPTNNDLEPTEQDEVHTDKPSIAGICLGDHFEKVENILGEDYEEIYNEESYYYGEPTYLRDYDDGEISFIVGEDSAEVLEISFTSDKYETWLGDKIGVTADEVLTKYRKEFTEPESIHTGEKLEGWFDVGDGVLIIFDFDKDDNMIVNTDISSDSKVELIKLTKMMYMD